VKDGTMTDTLDAPEAFTLAKMKFKQHPLSAAFPAMQDEEYQALVDSIGAIGVQNPITLFEGMVIDGWHRYRATTEEGMACPSVELGAVDPREFVLAQNKARRNLTASQRAAAVTSVYQWVAANVGRPRDAAAAPLAKTNAELAAIAGTSVRSVQLAKAVHSGGIQAVQDAVKTGAVTVETAAAVAKLPAKEQKKIAAKGPEAMRTAAKPAPEPEDDGPSAEELAANAAAQAADALMMQKLLESDAPLATALEENKRLNAEVAQLKQRMNGLMNEKNEAIGLVKSRDRQIAKLEKLLQVPA